MKPILVHSQAKAELREAEEYYEEQKPGLGAEFIDEVEDSWTAIQNSPGAFAVFQNSGYRQFLVRRFPYRVLYRETEQDIRVIAVAHFKRRPDYWKKRRFPEESP